MKRRTGPHQRAIRELRITAGGITIGEPLKNLRGIMSGMAVYEPLGELYDHEPDGGTA